jgi:hypothetical protein
MLANLIVLMLALSPVQAYNQGNRLYAQKDYAGAALAYEEALKVGPSTPVLYNLGNALFKSGKIGRAILNYRRARYLDPRDADIAANLNFARNYRVDKVLTVPSPFARALDEVFHRLSRREAALLAAVCFALAGLALAVWIVRRRTVFVIAASSFSALALFSFITQQVWSGEIDERPAVVVVPEINAQSGPSEESKQILLLHDGTEVRIREARAGYVLVQLPGGSGGWIRKDAVERVY